MLSSTLKTQLTCGLAAMALIGVATMSTAEAGAVRTGFDSSALAANDDLSTGLVGIGFTMNFFGGAQTQLYVNNNGNVTFNNPLSQYTPTGITAASAPIIAPFFADVDTRTGNLTRYGTGSVDGHDAFGVSWVDVGYYSMNVDKLNSFQLVIIDRSDVNAGDVDIEFNYDQIQWETGDASNGTDGLGGSSARVGWASGTGTFFEFAGSGVNGAFLDSGCPASLTGLICNTRNSDVDGRYLFEVRNGEVVELPGDGGQPGDVPEPATLALFGAGLLGLGALRQRARRG